MSDLSIFIRVRVLWFSESANV